MQQYKMPEEDTSSDNTEDKDSREKNYKVLIVDDETQLCRILGEYINELRGYDWESVNSLEEAKGAIDKGNIDIVFSDEDLGKDKGSELMDYVKENGLHTQIVMMTGHATDTNKAMQYIRRGASYFIPKPFNMKQIEESLDHVIEKMPSPEPEIHQSRMFSIMGDALGMPNLEEDAHTEKWFRGEGSGGRRQMQISLERALELRLMPHVMIINEEEDQRETLEDLLWETNRYNIFRARDIEEANSYLPGEVDLLLVSGEDAKYAKTIESCYDIGTLVLSDTDLAKTGVLIDEDIPLEGTEFLQREIDMELQKKKVDREMKKLKKQNISDLDKRVQSDPEDPHAHYRLAKAYLSANNDKLAIKSLKEALRLDPDFLDAWKEYVNLVDSRNDTEDLPLPMETAQQKLKQFSETSAKTGDTGMEVEVSMAYARASANIGKGEDAINAYKKILELQPENLEAHVRLGTLYISNGMNKEAEQIFRSIVENFPKNDLYIGLEHISDFQDLQEGLLLAEVSKNKVYGIVSKGWGKNFVIKVYDDEFRENAENEFRNLFELSKDGKPFIIPRENSVSLEVPRPVTYCPGENYSVLVLNRIEGSRFDEEFPRLNDRDKKDMLDLMVDSTVAISHKRTSAGDLGDVREEKYVINLDSGDIETNFYTWRFFTKFIKQFERYSDITLDDDEISKLVDLHEPMGKELEEAPDPLYLFYTDCNYRNFLRSRTVDPDKRTAMEKLMGFDPEMRVTDFRHIFRFDLENSDKRLMTLDLLTAAEHELYDFGRRDHSKYLARRAVLGIIGLETENPNVRENIQKILAFHTDTLRSKATSDPAKDKVREALKKYLPGFMEQRGYSMDVDSLDSLTTLSSAQRHLTVSGDKARDIHVYSQRIAAFRESHPDIVEEYESFMESLGKLSRESRKKMMVNDQEQLSNHERILRSYASWHQRMEDANEYLKGHMKGAREALIASRRKQFLNQLKKFYPI